MIQQQSIFPTLTCSVSGNNTQCCRVSHIIKNKKSSFEKERLIFLAMHAMFSITGIRTHHTRKKYIVHHVFVVISASPVPTPGMHLVGGVTTRFPYGKYHVICEESRNTRQT